MINSFAFFGTGPCDPNKGLKQTLAFVGVLVGWVILVGLIRKLNRSSKSNRFKIGASVALISLGVIGTASIFLATWLGLACSG